MANLGNIPVILVVARTQDIAYYWARNYLTPLDRQPILVSTQTLDTLIGKRNCIVILVDLNDLGLDYSYMLERNIIIRVAS